jgi:hypothetical protein
LCIRKKPRSFCAVGVLRAFGARSQGFYAFTALSLAYNPSHHFLPPFFLGAGFWGLAGPVYLGMGGAIGNCRQSKSGRGIAFAQLLQG